MFDRVADLVAEHFPDAVLAPYVQTGATDSRHFTAICEHVYRFAPFRMSAAQRRAIHSYDEHLGVDGVPGRHRLVPGPDRGTPDAGFPKPAWENDAWAPRRRPAGVRAHLTVPWSATSAPAALPRPSGCSSKDQWVDLQIQEAMKRGDFDNLPGAGKPIEGLGTDHDPDWWLKKLVEREKISVLPPALQLRKDDAELDAKLDRHTAESEVRRELEEFNARVMKARYTPVDGPPLITMPRDVEAEVDAWRERRLARRSARRPPGRPRHRPRSRQPLVAAGSGAVPAERLPRAVPLTGQAGFSHTDTCCSLSAVNGVRSQSAHRSFSRNPAIRAIRSSSAGHT